MKTIIDFNEARRLARQFGYTLTYKREYAEYRINVINGKEDTAYYTDSLADACNTMRAMHISSTGYIYCYTIRELEKTIGRALSHNECINMDIPLDTRDDRYAIAWTENGAWYCES